MILGRILSNSSFKSSAFATAYLHYHSSILSSFISHNVGHHKRRFSVKPRFNLERIRQPDDAVALFQDMLRMRPRPSVFHFTELLRVVVDMKQYSLALQLFDEMLQKDTSTKHNTLNIVMALFHKMGEIEKAIKVFDSAVNSGLKPNNVSYTTLMNGYCEKGEVDEVLRLFVEIPTKGLELDVVSFTMLLHSLQVCELRGDQNLVRAVHSHGIRSGLISNNMLRSSLLAAYANCGGSTAADAMRFFSEIHRDDAHRNEMDMIMCLKACSILACNLAGQVIHSYLTKTGFLADVIFQNALINVYAENGCHYSALLMFRSMHERDIISWTTIVKSFVENDDPAGALRLLGEIHRDDVRPDDDFTMMFESKML